MTNFSTDHAAGAHQDEIVTILEALEPCLAGHSRAVNVIALLRMVAVQLQPAAFETRKATIEAIPALCIKFWLAWIVSCREPAPDRCEAGAGDRRYGGHRSSSLSRRPKE